MRGFQKGITLGGRTPRSIHNAGLQNRVAKKIANFLHPSWDSYGGHERFPKRYNTWG